MFIRLCGLGEMSDHSADSEALRRVSNWLQIVISFFPCLFFFPLSSSHSDMPLSVLKHFFSCQDSGVKRSHFWSFAVTRGSWILLMLSGLIRKNDTDVCISPLPASGCHHPETWGQKEVASLSVIFSYQQSWRKRCVKLFPCIFLAELTQCSKIIEERWLIHWQLKVSSFRQPSTWIAAAAPLHSAAARHGPSAAWLQSQCMWECR